MSKSKSPKPAGTAPRSEPVRDQAQGSLFPEAAPVRAVTAPAGLPARGSAKARDEAAPRRAVARRTADPKPSPAPRSSTAPKSPAQPAVRGRRRPQPRGLAAFYAKLLSAGDYVEATVTLKPSMIGTHPAHPDRIVGGGAEAIKTLRYAIVGNVDGANLGNILVHGENRFTLVAPLIQERVTIHINLAAAAMRADITAESYIARANPAGVDDLRRA